MTMQTGRILTVLLAALVCVSIAFNAYLFAIVIPGKESAIASLTEQYGELRATDAEHVRLLGEANAAIREYAGEIARYEQTVQELSTKLNTTSGAFLGSASLDAPIVIQKVRPGSSEPVGGEKGGVITITVQVRYGEGRVLVETHPPLGLTFQETATTAVAAAQKFTGSNLSEKDVVFTVRSAVEPQQVEGPSAGALMGILLVSVLEPAHLNQNVTITGSITQNGYIGGVGGIVEKAEAAKADGKTLFLIPRENRSLRIQSTGYPGQVGIVDAKSYIESNVGIRTEYVDSLADLPGLMLEQA
jgi:predicted S18 family serine protease